MFCPECGSENPPESKFCRHCGINFEKKEAKKVTVEPDNTHQQRQSPPPNTKKDDDDKWCWGCCICMVFLFIIFALFGR